jgi:hypothetical protein
MELKESINQLKHFKANVDREWNNLCTYGTEEALGELQFDLTIFYAKINTLMEETLRCQLQQERELE